MKAITNTTISFGMVRLPVQVMQAIETANDVTFKLAGPKGEPLTQFYADPDGTVVPRDDMQKGMFQGEQFFPISKDDLAAIEDATKIEGLPIDEVVDADEFWSRAHRICGMYYVQSSQSKTAKGSINAFKLFVDVLEARGEVMVTKWTARSRQKQLVLWPKDGILYASALTFAGDVREADDGVRAHLAGTYSQAEYEMADKLLAAMRQDRSTALEMEVDDAVVLKAKLVDDALAGHGIEAPVRSTPDVQKTTALADSLAASLAALGEKVAA